MGCRYYEAFGVVGCQLFFSRVMFCSLLLNIASCAYLKDCLISQVGGSKYTIRHENKCVKCDALSLREFV